MLANCCVELCEQFASLRLSAATSRIPSKWRR